MAKYIIDSDTLDNLGNAIRTVNGSTKKYTPEEMVEEVSNLLNAATFILVDKDGNEYPAMYVESDIEFTATANDIRKGAVAITAEGITTGTKEIPAYYTTEGIAAVPPGSEFIIDINRCEFTKLQTLMCAFNTNLANSVATDKVSINGKVYPVNSTEVIATVTVDSANNRINLGITNDSTKPYVLRYFTYKEEY